MHENDYEQILTLSKEAKTLEGVRRLVEWDQETYMPKGASDIRAEQISLLAGISHEMLTSKKYINALEKLIDIESGQIKKEGLGEEKESALREWRRDLVKAVALPLPFVKKFAKLTSEALHVWQRARAESNFSLFFPYLQQIVDMSLEKASLVGYEETPYDALLDEYEPGMTSSEVGRIFSKLGEKVRTLLEEIKKAPQVDSSFLHGSFDKEAQLAFSKELLETLGYSFEHGRLDISTHPFSTSFHPSDSRITTRFHNDSVIDPIMATVHEAGHSFYEMGLPEHYFGSPLCEAISLGMHESQSRFWETRIGQSRPFWRHFLPKLQAKFPNQLKKVGLEQFYRAINRVEPTLIRVEADEVTYPLHVILRYEMERGIMDGSIPLKNVPAAWNEKMKHYLGVTPSSDREGCLQDIHWAMGGFGYFPTYTLGNLYAAHLFEGFEKAFPDWQESVANGEFAFIKQWLNEKVHAHGRRYRSIDLLKRIHAKEFSEKPYIDYLTTKYRDIYAPKNTTRTGA